VYSALRQYAHQKKQQASSVVTYKHQGPRLSAVEDKSTQKTSSKSELRTPKVDEMQNKTFPF